MKIDWHGKERDLSKLPKWAQSYTKALARNLAAQIERYNDLFDAESADTFLLETHKIEGREKPLGEEQEILFRLSDQWVDHFTVAIRNDAYEGRYLSIRCGQGLYIVPRASNSLRLYAGREKIWKK